MAVPRYLPPTRVVTIEVPWLSVVTRVDPNWGRDRHREIQYEFTNRRWFANTDVDGPYSPYSSLWQQGLPNILSVAAPSGDFSSDFGGDFA